MRCRSCGAEIEWLTTRRGAQMPVDAKPIKVMTREGDMIEGYVSHFATCPNASEHRRGRQDGLRLR